MGKGKGKEGSSDIGSRLSPPPRLGSAAIHPMNIDQERVEERRENRREEKRRWFPWLVPVFVIANVVLFVITMYVNNCPETMENCVGTFLGRFSFQPVKENPLLGPSSATLEKMGALEVSKVVQQHQGWRLISCIWLHAGVVHIAANMLSLLLIGIRLEQEFGFFKVGVVYILAGLGGSLLSALFIQSSISVGASGALFGLLGAMLSELITNWTIYSNKFVTMTVLVLLIVVNLAVGILPHVDNFAHIGGFISGFLLGFVFLIQPQYGWVSKKHVPPGYDLPRQSSKHKSYQYIYFATALVLLIAGFVTAFVLLFGGFNANDHCSWCHYLSCVPTPAWNCNAQNITCSSTTLGNQITLTCDSNGRVKTYAADSNPNLTQLCIQLCT